MASEQFPSDPFTPPEKLVRGEHTYLRVALLRPKVDQNHASVYIVCRWNYEEPIVELDPNVRNYQ
jgi:hypothetical protein